MNSNNNQWPTKIARDGTRRGGARSGAGRKRKELRSPTAINPVDLAAALAAPAPIEIEAALSGQALRSLDALVKLMTHGSSDAARIGAAAEILDRGYGRPAVDIGGDSAMPMLPLQMAPQKPSMSLIVREEARKYAELAKLVLLKIAENSLSETARQSANKALIRREIGTVGVAKMLEERSDAPLGKKELAARAAEAATTGAFAPRPAPLAGR